ncbi:efflux RND transporter periplasmic adaptor subunit [Vibrio navarrensis]|uniref:Efflux RND transporter periplasmic adaptor subunit n=1 Tax=Vibrio navarrensis TaxID=29495 RepID=A0AAI9G946_9VIBR|nr:efflux RND transporter periplasmic adaptor subunit [Vibrio navarrensis]
MSKATLKKKLLIFLAIILLASMVGYFFYPQQAPLSFATETVRRGNIEQTVLATGMLQASKLVAVGAQVSGQIEKLAAQLGDELKQDDLVAQIDSLTQQNSLKEANAALNSLNAQIRAKQAQIHQAQAEYNRQKGMLADNASSRSDYESAEASLTIYKAELEQLKAELERAKISVDNAKLDLGYTTIRAPFDGTVVYSAVEEGQTVNANQTTPTIIELAKLDKMTIKAQISEADVVNVHPGLPVYFTILGKPNKRYHGTLRAIEPGPTLMDGDDKDLSVSNDEAIYYHGLFEVDNPDRVLRIGMTAQVSVVLDQANDVLLVPSQVLIRQPGAKDRYQVPVLENGKEVLRDVTVGINNKVNAQITSGLAEGEQVILGMPGQSATSSGRRMGPQGIRF